MTLVENTHELRFVCNTCPYTFPVHEKETKTTLLERKKVDDVLGGKEAWENVDKTAAQCPKCFHTLAFFYQAQLRSADEPMSIFYKCCECGHQWRHD
eukprot:TRINITY_DN1966_c0_g1_i1.p3 TRINITY_DN1966_c0_g1~~TRINITY_DN1966_c0_g1_i1.p3  ORF type:complete len:108 (+),score=22.81 TRINITY_DN1966_c0_g1_i1:35-325(+)